MVQNAGADDLVEDLSETSDVFDRKPVEIEVPDAVFPLKLAGVAEAGFADVDRGDTRVRLAHRMNNGLRRAAAGDQDLAIRRRLSRRPKEKRHRPSAIRIAIELAMPVEVAERRRIRMALVKGPHFVARTGRP